MVVIGIDPGNEGGLCLLGPRSVEVFPLGPDIWERYINIGSVAVIGGVAVVEKQFMVRNQCRQFYIAQKYGELIAILTLHQLEVYEVPPVTWMRHFGFKKTKRTPKPSVPFVLKKYPKLKKIIYTTHKGNVSKNPNHNLTDAVCIALYGRDLLSK